MKSSITRLLSCVLAGLIGGFSYTMLFNAKNTSIEYSPAPEVIQNPFKTTSIEPDNLQIEQLLQRVDQLEFELQEIKNQTASIEHNTNTEESSPQSIINIARRPVQPNTEDLITAGVNPELAEDILRRISQQEYRRLQLQNLISRGTQEEKRYYRKELRELTTNPISLRDELGEAQYDNYLYSSGQNNRVKISSIMAGSPAETAGFETGDVILSYDSKKVLNWNDLRKITREGDINSYTNVEVLRDGQPMMLVVSRGTLGVKLDTIRLDPDL